MLSWECLTLQPISVLLPHMARCSIAQPRHFMYQHFSVAFFTRSPSCHLLSPRLNEVKIAYLQCSVLVDHWGRTHVGYSSKSCQLLYFLVASSFLLCCLFPTTRHSCVRKRNCRTQLAEILSLLEIGLSLSYVDVISNTIYAPSR